MEAEARATRQRRHGQYGNSSSRTNPHDIWNDDESELLQDYVAYQERRMQEIEDKRAMARAVLLQAEQEKREAELKAEEEKRAAELKAQQEEKRRVEEASRREVEQKAVEAYIKEQNDMQARIAERKETFRSELSRLDLPIDQIERIMKESNLDFINMATLPYTFT